MDQILPNEHSMGTTGSNGTTSGVPQAVRGGHLETTTRPDSEFRRDKERLRSTAAAAAAARTYELPG